MSRQTFEQKKSEDIELKRIYVTPEGDSPEALYLAAGNICSQGVIA